MKKSDILILETVTPSLNITSREHRYSRDKKKRKTDYLWELKAQMLNHKIRKANVGESFSIRIEQYRNKLLDYDNLVGGAKQLLDCLHDTAIMFIWDDDPDYLTKIEYHQTLINKSAYDKPKTIITRTYENNK